MSQVDVFFYEAFDEERALIEKYLPSSIKAGFARETIQETGHQTPPASVISTRTQSQIPGQWSSRLTAILSRSTGYNHMQDYRESTGFSGQMGYLPLYCNRAVAEQAMLLWMSLLRKLPLQMERFNSFSRSGLTGYECSGKNLLVVGVGNIGHEVVRIGKGLDMNVYGVDLIKKFDDTNYVEVEEGIAQAHIVVSAMNLTKKNRGYFNYQLLKKAPAGVIFVNVARGELSPIDDLYRLVKEGHLGGLALDVYEQESKIAIFLRSGAARGGDPLLQKIKELQQLPNVIFTPHNAFNSHEAVLRKAEHSVKQIEHFLQSGRFLWPVPEE
ncbi:NAD(P)-dependent oxidoreductase [Calditrichota bacterium LG25]